MEKTPPQTSTRRRNRYVLAVAAATVLGLAAPAVLNAALPDDSNLEYATAAEAFESNLLGYEDWPLHFGALDDCAAPNSGDALGIPEFWCAGEVAASEGDAGGEDGAGAAEGAAGEAGGVLVEAISMMNPKDPALAIDRAIRAMNFVDLQSMEPREYTTRALKISPDLLERTGAAQVWATDYYELSSESSVDGNLDPITESELNRAIAFYRPATETREGNMLILQVTASGVANTKRMVQELLRTAELAHAEGAGGTEGAGEERVDAGK